MDFLLNDSAKNIRSFLDRMVFGLFHDKIHHLVHYEKTRKERITLLSRGNFDTAWMDKIEYEMSISAAEWTATRIKFIQALNSQHMHKTLPKAQINLQENLQHDQEMQSQYQNKLKAARQKDAVTGTTSIGPHRTRIKITGDKLHSTGEQKAAIISLLLEGASLRKLRNKQPILLLDEVLSHMDADFQLKIISCLQDFQTWITCTHFSHKVGNQFTCENGMLSKNNVV